MLEVLLLIFIFIISHYFQLPPAILFIFTIIILPSLYQAFQNAPFVPFPQQKLTQIFSVLKKQFKLQGKTFIDIGCGDGRVLQLAEQQGAKCVGYEISIPTFLLAKYKTRSNSNIKIFFKNFWKQELTNYDFIYIFMQQKPMVKFYQEVWPKLKPQTVVVSAAFRIHGLKAKYQGQGYYIYVKA